MWVDGRDSLFVCLTYLSLSVTFVEVPWVLHVLVRVAVVMGAGCIVLVTVVMGAGLIMVVPRGFLLPCIFTVFFVVMVVGARFFMLITVRVGYLKGNKIKDGMKLRKYVIEMKRMEFGIARDVKPKRRGAKRLKKTKEGTKMSI